MARLLLGQKKAYEIPGLAPLALANHSIILSLTLGYWKKDEIGVDWSDQSNYCHSRLGCCPRCSLPPKQASKQKREKPGMSSSDKNGGLGVPGFI